MADAIGQTSSEEELSMDTFDELPQRGGLHHTSSEEEDDRPATKRDNKSLHKDIRSLIQADLAIIREDIHSLTGRVKLTEEEVSGLLTSQTAMQEAQATTSRAQESLAAKMADLEDKSLVSSLDKMAILAAVRDSACDFKSRMLSFYSDLSRATLMWRRSMRPVTGVLQRHGIPSRWGNPCSLQVTKEGMLHHITEAAEFRSFP
ncbi:Hypothetical predicted protein [Pelobates cultripes]|uniref:Uncharacterized protein n=1 Tax=Pelobates cultripes TaxID=61616 RepID=A0AAD1TIF4_PELCU|nr:Hypothetical predicted protein [Pelobates cultripes]